MGKVVYTRTTPAFRGGGFFGNNPDLSRMAYIEAAVWAYEPNASVFLQFDVSLDGSRCNKFKMQVIQSVCTGSTPVASSWPSKTFIPAAVFGSCFP